MTGPVTWVIGSGGLLGSAVVRELRRRRQDVIVTSVPWADEDDAVHALLEASTEVMSGDRPWRITWCAGAGVVSTSQEELDQEVRVIRRFLDGLAGRLAGTAAAGRGGVFLASSAGGVYAGSAASPFTEATAPVPISPYGHAKLATEEVVRAFAAASGVPTLVGRIANLYGPGQDISKAQGLISQLCKSQLRRQPISIYVSLDTARDYLYVDDCARMVLDGLEEVCQGADVHLKILASGRGTTIAAILAELRRVTKRRPMVVLAANPLARFQAKDLRFDSQVLTELDRHISTSLPSGIKSTLESLGMDMRAGHLAST